MALKNNTWTLNAWYDQDVAGNVSYTGKTQIWAWGSQENTIFAQGYGNNTSYSSPVQIPGDTWKNLPQGANSPSQLKHIFATKTDGTLWGWGRNIFRIIKGGTNDDQHSPVQIPGTTWLKASPTQNSCSFLKTDGTLWVMGENAKGVFGTNQTASNPGIIMRSSPVQVTGSWSDIHGGNEYQIAVQTDGTLWAWGQNGNGRLGLNDNVQRSSPTQIPGDNWLKPVAGHNGSGAIKTDGSLWAWGWNAKGQLGLNNTTAYSSPIQIGSDTTWLSVAIGGEKMLATKTDGTLWGWGNHAAGSLGLNQGPGNISSPTQIPGTTWYNVVSLSYGNGLATKTDGTLWIWGDNVRGELGQNQGPSQLTAVSSPVQVPGTWEGGRFIFDGHSLMAIRTV